MWQVKQRWLAALLKFIMWEKLPALCTLWHVRQPTTYWLVPAVSTHSLRRRVPQLLTTEWLAFCGLKRVLVAVG